MERKEVMLEVINSIPPPLSKTALVKLLYFLQECYDVGLGYEFTFYTHGLYTHEILKELDCLYEDGLVRIERRPDLFQGYPGFAIFGTPVEQELGEGINKKISTLRDRFGLRNARELELRATLHFIRHFGGLEGGELFSTVHEMKPKYNMEEIEQAGRELKDLL
ncbi:hypothetical protein KAU45_03410 [bacterium]|nr:hypothetical protein [bacterium]